ncbi:MAG TPA: MG2 domain-containing protein [Armatimonadota bacterium]|jgi:hypothetical protein
MKPRLEPLLLIALVVAIAGGIVGVMSGETPVGSVRGQIVAAESGNPLPHLRIALAPNDSADNQSKYRMTRTDANGRFAFAAIPVGEYHLITHAQAHEEPKEMLQVNEGKTLEAVYELKPVEPYIRVFNSQRVFATAEAPKLRVNGFAPSKTMSVTTYRLSDSGARKAWHGALRDVLRTSSDNIADAPLDQSPDLSQVDASSVSIAQRDVEGVFRQDVSLPKLPPGTYVVAMNAAEVKTLGVIVVTDLGLLVKTTDDEVFVFAADIKTGEPVEGAELEVRRGDTVVSRGTTDASGFATLRAPVTDAEHEIVVVGHSGGSTAIASVSVWRGDSHDLKAYTVTDRPVYRPGHTVHFRTLLRRLNRDQYSIPNGIEATVTVTDPRQDVLYHKALTANAFGSFWGDVRLNRAALPGIYTINIRADGQEQESIFNVAEYRKPEYEVTVTPEKQRYTQRDDVKATISARYYYGAPVPNAAVRYYVTRSERYYYEDAYDFDSDIQGDGDGSDEYSSGESIASGDGRTDADGRFTVTVPPQDIPEEGGSDYRYVVHATVTDLSKREQEGAGGVLVTQGDYRVSVDTDAYLVRPGQGVHLTVKTVDYDGHPVAGARGTLKLTRHIWVEDRQEDREATSLSWQTDASGMAVLTVTPAKEGDYGLLAVSRDQHGSDIRAASGLWVMSGDYADLGYSYGDLEVKAGKKLYKEGETAEVLVQTRFANQTAVLTIEGPRLLQKRLVRLTGKSTVLRVPITSDFVPSVRASVSFFHAKGMISGDGVIHVSRERKALKVQVTSDKPTYQPGEKATWRVKTLDPDGKPVSAEVCLGVVDASIYAIMPDSAPNIVEHFYPQRMDGVQTSWSYPDIYLSGDDKAGANIKTRRNFPDTAFWTPSSITDPNGDASFTMTMPDSLTTWRATCRAATTDTRVGQTTAEAIVTKPFLVRLEAPRFLVQGDEVELAGVAHNLTGKDADAQVGMEATNCDAPGKSQSRRVTNGATERFSWRVRAKGVGEARIRVWAKSGAYSDAMELAIPVLPKGRPISEARNGATDGRETFSLNVRSDAIPSTRRLTLKFAPTMAASLFASLDYLASYPYGCTEQTMSGFLPDIIVSDVMKRQGIRSAGLERRLPDMVNAGLLRLYGMQHQDGGWRWFRYDKTDPWMTAYVMYGFIRARQAGFDVNPEVFSRGARALAASAGEEDITPDNRAFCARVLALLGRRDLAAQVAARANTGPEAPAKTRLTDWGRAQLAMALDEMGRSNEARENLAILWRHLSESAYRPTMSDDWWRADGEQAAAFLLAACQVTPRDRRLSDLAGWIMRQRRGDAWCSTRDTAAIVEAMSHYVTITRELTPDFTANVSVNGRPVLSRRFTRADIALPAVVASVPDKDLGPGPLFIEVKKAGAGRLYYTATLEQTVAADLTLPVLNDSGIAVERSYRRYAPTDMKRDDGPGDPKERRTRADSGDIIEVTLTIRAQKSFDYLMLEDPIPAGCEARDRGMVEEWEWGYWWSDQIVRDHMVSFAIQHLDAGSRTITYRLYSQIPGDYTALPPTVYDMYNPAVRAEGVAHEVTIR